MLKHKKIKLIKNSSRYVFLQNFKNVEVQITIGEVRITISFPDSSMV